MIWRKIREHANIELTLIDPVQLEADRRCFDHRVLASCGAHLRQLALHFVRLDRRHVGRVQFDGVAGCELDAAEIAGAMACRVQDVGDEMGGRGLTVGAGDADRPECARRISRNRRCRASDRGARVGHGDKGDIIAYE